MPKSLKCKLSTLHYQGRITEDEYKELIEKLEGHDKALMVPLLDSLEQALNLVEKYRNLAKQYYDIIHIKLEDKS